MPKDNCVNVSRCQLTCILLVSNHEFRKEAFTPSRDVNEQIYCFVKNYCLNNGDS